jgi:hypothetical protein
MKWCFRIEPYLIRIRSSRFGAYSRWVKVGKGSRQNRSVTSGKGLALMMGLRELALLVIDESVNLVFMRKCGCWIF